MTHKDDPLEPDALVLSTRKLISDAPISAQGAGVVAPLVLQASQRVAAAILGAGCAHACGSSQRRCSGPRAAQA